MPSPKVSMLFKNMLRTACGLLIALPLEVSAAAYQAEAYGRDEASALGNLKMKALRDALKEVLSAEDIKDHARVLRAEVLLKIDDYVKAGNDVVYTEKNKKIFASGMVEVDQEALLRKLGSIAELDGRIGGLESEAQPGVHQPSERIEVMPANRFMDLVSAHPGKEAEIIAALDAGMDPDTRRIEADAPVGEPALYVYIASGGRDRDVLGAFVSHRPDVMWKNADGETVVLEKLLETDDVTIGRVLDELKPDFGQAVFRYSSPLAVYLSFKHDAHDSDLEVVKNLQKMLSLGCDPNEMLESDGGKHFKPAIFAAIRRNAQSLWSPEVLETLLRAGADPNKTDDKGKTALFVAAAENAPEHIARLALHGANPDAFNRQGRSALMYFTDSNTDVATYKALIAVKAGVNLKSPADDGYTPLISVVEAGNLPFARLLVEAGADVNLPDRAGRYPMNHAVLEPDMDMIRFLCESGADLKKAAAAPAEDDKTLLEYLTEDVDEADEGFLEIRNYLLERINRK
ncbi:MAG: ankyrin repeat domain-containing protein [Succinivibrionaceae bacterium]|nr:ankyrin repeat domain-containing protein [Succinivibrionaceae bacterium]